ncbi:hypothetical protein C8J56DRAFT_828834 [Mycena floridula]|nr:hypothetical protein C8J56DRAFT_828834 [Mycena floridula]
MSIDTALEQTIQSLSDPKNPTFCCRYYLCLVAQIPINGQAWENPCIMTSEHEQISVNIYDLCYEKTLFNALAAFFTIGRSREEMAALAHRMENCECDRSDSTVDWLHSWSWKDGAYSRDPGSFMVRNDTLGCLIAIIADVFGVALQMQNLDVLPDLRPELRREFWPLTRQDYLSDDETAVTMICRWLDEYPYPPLLRIIYDTAHSLNPPALAQILFLQSAHLPQNLVRFLKRGIDSIPPGFPGSDDPFGVVYPITLVFLTMREIFDTVASTVSPAYFFREHCTLFLETMNRVAELNNRMYWGSAYPVWEGGLRIAGRVHEKLVLPFDQTLYHPRILFYSQVHRADVLGLQAPYQLAQTILLTLAEMAPQCMNIQCTNGVPGSLCSGCRRVAYCSPECQTIDWKGKPPHKKVCRNIKALGDAANFPHYAAPKILPPQIEVEEFQRLVSDAVPLTDVVLFNKYMVEDDRIRKILNDKHSPRYERLLE